MRPSSGKATPLKRKITPDKWRYVPAFSLSTAGLQNHERSIMENVHLWAQPLILLTAFIFFWREAKGSRRELKADIGKELNKIDVRFNRFEDNIWERFEKLTQNLTR